MSPRLLLLYGLDEQTLPVDAECTREMVPRAANALRSKGWEVETCQADNELETDLAAFSPRQWIIFNLCEGSPTQPHYYARVAEILEQGGYAFTGSGARSLEETQFKDKMKRLLEADHLPTPKWSFVKNAEDLSFDLFPALVKPAGEHCSFGITRESVVFSTEEARKRADWVIKQYQGGAIIEEFVDGDEYGVALLETGERLEILGISVIKYGSLPDVRDRLCTFEAKWQPETEIYKKTMPVCPAPLGPEMRDRLESLARRAHLACGVRDYSRIDLRLQQDQPLILDVNANCALTENAGFPDTARIAGWSYSALLDRLARMAALRGSFA
jgi:D-alanine-D-alanine ligase